MSVHRYSTEEAWLHKYASYTPAYGRDNFELPRRQRRASESSPLIATRRRLLPACPSQGQLGPAPAWGQFDRIDPAKLNGRSREDQSINYGSQDQAIDYRSPDFQPITHGSQDQPIDYRSPDFQPITHGSQDQSIKYRSLDQSITHGSQKDQSLNRRSHQLVNHRSHEDQSITHKSAKGLHRRRTTSGGFAPFAPQSFAQVESPLGRPFSPSEQRRLFYRKGSENQLSFRKSSITVERALQRKYSETVCIRSKMVERMERKKEMNSVGEGIECAMCGRGLGVSNQSYAVVCYHCRKHICLKTCGLEVFDGEKGAVALCKVCNDRRQDWKPGADYRSPAARYSEPPRPVHDHRATHAGPSDHRSHNDPPGRRTSREDDSFERHNYREKRQVVAQEYEHDYAPSTPQPRWAATKPETAKRREAMRTPRRSVSVSHCYSSSEDEGHAASDQWDSEDERNVEARATDPIGRSDVDEPAAESDASCNDQPEGDSSVDTRDATVDGPGTAPGAAPSHVARPTSISPASCDVSTAPAPKPLQPPAPAFGKCATDINGQLRVGAMAAASRRASLAAVERLVGKMAVDGTVKLDQQSAEATYRPASPQLASSPEDDQTCLGTLEFSTIYDAGAQTLTISIIRATNLRARDKNGFSDPYVKLHLIPGAAKSTKLRTRTIAKTLHPEWNENLVYYGISDEERMKKTLRLLVLDEDRIGADFLGETRVPLKRLTSGKEKSFNVYLESQLPLQKTDNQAEGRGKILLSLCYNNEKLALIVEIIRCAELIGMDPNGYSDPYVKMALLPDGDKKHKAKTKTKKKTLNPVFDESFSFSVQFADLMKKTLEITVWDKDVGKHDDYLGGVLLGIDCRGDRSKHWNAFIQNPGTKCQRWHKLTDENFPHSTSSTT